MYTYMHNTYSGDYMVIKNEFKSFVGECLYLEAIMFSQINERSLNVIQFLLYEKLKIHK